MTNLYDVAKQRSEEILSEVELGRLAKRLRVVHQRRAGMGRASTLMWVLESGASRLFKLSRALKVPLLALAAYSSLSRKP